MDFTALFRQEEQQRRKQRDEEEKKTILTPSLTSQQHWKSTWWDLPPSEFQLNPNLSYFPNVIGDMARHQLVLHAMMEPGWTQLTRRALLNLGGVPHSDGLLEQPLPSWLTDLISELTSITSVEIPNQALINRYAPRGGIAAHNDGPLFHPRAAILSLSGSAVLRFYDDHSLQIASVVLEPGSLCIFSGLFYTHMKHAIVTLPPSHEKQLVEIIPPDVLNRHLMHDPVLQVIDRSLERISITLRRAPVARRIPVDLDSELRRREAWWRNAIDERSSV